MSRRKGSNSRRIDNDFDRNGRFLMSRDGDSVTNGQTKQLFDPRSDNPIKFNQAKHEALNAERRLASRPSRHQREEPPFRREDAASRSPLRREQSPIRREEELQQRVSPSGRRLWSPDDNQHVTPAITSPLKQMEIISPIVKIKPSNNNTSTPPIEKLVKKNPTKEKISSPPEPVKEKSTVDIQPEQEQDAHRKALKALIATIRQIESQLETLATTSRELPCFSEDVQDAHQDRRSVDKVVTLPSIDDNDIFQSDQIWKEKINLHLALGEKYLEVMRCDLEYAEKKGLESLCWKRAVYSLVDQFRHALKKSADALAAKPKEQPSKLTAMFDDEEEVVPVIHEGGGMTFVKVETKEDKTAKKEAHTKLHVRQAKMILTNFLTYLDLADDFYLKLTQFLKSIDDETDDEIEACLVQWRRVQRYKWYACIPLRGDIARYRWVYTSDEKIDRSDTDEEEISTWTKAQAFEEVWRRYYLGIWLMPAKGNLYFNLSLLLQQTPPQNTQGHEFHKLYFSTRSLMVRRNGFLNARESMLALFESNRRWIHKYVQDKSAKMENKRQKSNKSITPKKYLRDKKDATIPALFVRMHGMLFTKIGLDEFPKIKRIFFDILFERKTLDLDEYRYDGKKEDMVDRQLTSEHFFWIEIVIMCLSSLYSYNFANSSLSKLFALNMKRLFYNEDSEQFKTLADEMNDNILFSHSIDLTCQIAVELFQRYLDINIPPPIVPQVPELPHVCLNFKQNKDFLFENHRKRPAPSIPKPDTDSLSWLVYIEILLHWMVLNGICIRTKETPSLWELTVGDIGYDLIAYRRKRFMDLLDASKISPAFWPLLLQFLNKLLSELPEEDKYDMINKHMMDDDDDVVQSDISETEYAFAKHVLSILGERPDLPEEDHLRGLGWVDDIHGRFLKLNPKIKKETKPMSDVIKCRKMKVLEYGFTLVKHLDDILYYDPVEEIFTISKSVEERVSELEKEKEREVMKPVEIQEEDNVIMTSIAEMEDDVLLSSETEFDEPSEGDDITTQLKKRREQLQSMVATAEAEERYGYRRLPNRVKEREARLNYLRERIIPGKTILVLDTNCFIGHIDYVQKLFKAQKWSIIVPLVVVTELDGLKTNAHRLGRVAQEGIQLLETTLAEKPKQSTSLRIQTSHNNFMNDISIRSEQFVFGESDKNLDDLILSSCLWWISNASKDSSDKTVPVCLVTGDRNLSVKARARDVEVVPVSAVIQLTPK